MMHSSGISWNDPAYPSNIHKPDDETGIELLPIDRSKHSNPLPSKEEVLAKLHEANKAIVEKRENENAKKFFEAISFLAGVGLGVITALAIVGVATTPVGWGILGAALLIGVVGCAYYGGPKEFLEALKLAAEGFTVSLSITLFFGIPHIAVPSGMSIADSGWTGPWLGSLFGFMASLEITGLDLVLKGIGQPKMSMSPEQEKKILGTLKYLWNEA